MYLCGMLLCVYALVANVMCSLWRQISPLGTITSIHLSYSAYTVYNSIKWRLINWQTLLFNGYMFRKTDYCCFPLQEPRTTNFSLECKAITGSSVSASRRNLLLLEWGRPVSPHAQSPSSHSAAVIIWLPLKMTTTLCLSVDQRNWIQTDSFAVCRSCWITPRCLRSTAFAYWVLALEQTGLRTNKAHTAANWESSKHL